MNDFVPLAELAEPPAASVTAARVALVSLGCSRNLVDAEQMLGVLSAHGYRLTRQLDQAEVIIVNTCSFIASARDEAVRTIREAARWKQTGCCDALVVAGCMAQKEPDEVARRCPEVDCIVGLSEFPSLPKLLEQVRGPARRRPVAVSLPDLPYQEYLPRLRATPPWTAYLKIAEGCDCACTFCTIPTIRGRFRSRAVSDIVAEAERLVADGVRELVLIAEDLTHYGHDLAGRRELSSLLRALGELDGLAWVRLLYCYPTKVDEALIEAMATTPNVARYLDMPLQHADDGILRAMGRGGRRAGYLRLIARLRAAMPDLCVRSTFIVGFPGERHHELARLRDFLAEAQLDRVGFFCYSREPGTPAAELPGQVPRPVAEARLASLAAEQAVISRQRNEGWIGRRLTVLAEQREAGGGVGRSFRDAPEIDGVVRYSGAAEPGEMVTVEVTAADDHDLRGVLVEE